MVLGTFIKDLVRDNDHILQVHLKHLDGHIEEVL
jgi:hypothetical protein